MTRFSSSDRAKLFYFVNRTFAPAQVSRAGIYGGYSGGQQQRLLESQLRERLGVFTLSDEHHASVEGKLKGFIMTASDEQLVTMLELMPVVEEVSDRGMYRADPGRVAKEIEGFLTSIGIEMRFRHGKLEVLSADQAPVALKALPDRESLKGELESRAEEPFQVSVVFIDLDNFKAVNDRKGHAAGDACLERVAAIISEAVAKKGRTYRYGGDEFAVILPNFTAPEAMAVAERIRSAIDENSPDPDVKVTASIGVAGASAGLNSPETLLNAADEAAYASKFNGKNIVMCWPVDSALADRIAEARQRADLQQRPPP